MEAVSARKLNRKVLVTVHSCGEQQCDCLLQQTWKLRSPGTLLNMEQRKYSSLVPDTTHKDFRPKCQKDELHTSATLFIRLSEGIGYHIPLVTKLNAFIGREKFSILSITNYPRIAPPGSRPQFWKKGRYPDGTRGRCSGWVRVIQRSNSLTHNGLREPEPLYLRFR